MRPYAIGFIFSNKCEVREGDIRKKKRGQGGEKLSDRVSHHSMDPDGVSLDPLGLGEAQETQSPPGLSLFTVR